MPQHRFLMPLVVATVAGTLHAPLLAEETNNPCGALFMGQYGPFDYRTQRGKLHIVDQYHFTPDVEGLIRGATGTIGSDLTYTLRSSPNHVRALLSATRLAERTKPIQPEGLAYSVDCLYERAIRFAPDDVIVRELYARFLNRKGDRPGARRQLTLATGLAADDGFANYNIGLIYLEIGDYDEAVASAWRAQALGFDRVELKSQLQRLNKWRDSPAPSEAPASAPAEPSSLREAKPDKALDD